MSECKNTVFHQNVCDGIENAEHSDCHECGAIALQSEVYRLRDELEKATEEISDLQFTVQKEWEARNRFQVELKTAKGLCHDASSELSRLREELARARMARDCVNCKNNGMDCSKRNYSCAGFEIKEAAK